MRCAIGACALALVLLVPAVGAGPGASESWTVGVFPSGAEFRLERAVDAEQRRRGYMFRERVGPYEGMLFVFDAPGWHAIWMKNCRVPLDVIWLDQGFRVLEIAEELQPCPPEGECPNAFPFRAAHYVLEVAGGVAAREGLEAGDRIAIVAEPPLR